MLDTLTEALTAFTVSLSFVDRQTQKSKDKAPKQHHYVGRKNSLGSYHYPNYFSRIGPEKGRGHSAIKIGSRISVSKDSFDYNTREERYLLTAIKMAGVYNDFIKV